jgi:hypothetical protein
MPIDAVNSAMTPLQFARERSLIRTVENSVALSSGSQGSGRAISTRAAAAPAAAPQPHRMIPPATFHWSYRPAHVNGKQVAKRTLQFADTSFWSIAINHFG